MGSDDTLYAMIHGVVSFTRYRGTRRKVHVMPETAAKAS
jgi:ribosomal protein L27